MTFFNETNRSKIRSWRLWRAFTSFLLDSSSLCI
jgi:hypothetical protein